MLTTLNNKRSLTFYQPTAISIPNRISTEYSGGIGSVAVANTSAITTTTTTGFNRELNSFLNQFNTLREADAVRLDLTTPSQNARNTGVKRAWQYEKADIAMGGKGSANWSEQEQQQIQTSKSNTVRGSEGHHQQNVANHPEHQANPDNIKFYKSREEHRNQGHDGDFRNESNAAMIDKNQMLKKTNFKRVFKNEVRGIGIAVGIGLGVGFTIGFSVSLAQYGVTPESLKLALIEGSKSGAESGIMTGIGYSIGRTIGEVATKAVTGMLGNIGLTITDNITKMCSMGVVGSLTIAVFSVYQFIKLKQKGLANRDALMIVGKQALFSLTLLAVSIAAQGIWGGTAGIIVSVSIGVIMISYSLAEVVHQRTFSEKVHIYMIDKCRPEY